MKGRKERKVSRREKRRNREDRSLEASIRTFHLSSMHTCMHPTLLSQDKQGPENWDDLGAVKVPPSTVSHMFTDTGIWLDITCKVPGIVSGTYLVLSKPWLSLYRHHHHRVVRSLRTDELFMRFEISGLAVFSAEVRVLERTLTHWLTEWIHFWALTPCRYL